MGGFALSSYAKPVIVRVVFESGASLALEVVDTPEGRQRGLMYRKEMPEGWGMLFVFEESRPLGFWMKNTYLPLSIAFLTEDAVISNIRKMRPLDEVTRHRSRGAAKYAIEVPRGWFQSHGVKPGQRVNFLRKELLFGESTPKIPGEVKEILPQVQNILEAPLKREAEEAGQ